ncbi:MAG: hypothetical protein IH849_08145 [Acidobacteria bacterium]|nr:hypothetical protein [Acidobacteriota bacterium]
MDRNIGEALLQQAIVLEKEAKGIGAKIAELEKQRSSLEDQEEMLDETRAHLLATASYYGVDIPAENAQRDNGKPSAKQAILAIMREDSNRNWATSEIIDAVSAAGYEFAEATIRSHLSKAASSGQLGKAGWGFYTYLDEGDTE